jgi:hypothetical protein
MKEIEGILEPIGGYMLSIERDTINGWYFMKVGIPKNWVFDENNEIGYEILSEANEGKLLKIFPKKQTVVIDDLIAFVEIIIHTNETIAAKEKEFADQMQEFKVSLEKKASNFYKELDELKDNSFKKLNDKFVTELVSGKKRRKPRTPKVKIEETKEVSGYTETYIPPKIKTEEFPT